MKTWTETDPKAEVMARSRASLVKAAREAFLSSGYGESSVNRIAQEAGVSIKTLYRHFDSKDELFGAVIAGLCVYAYLERWTSRRHWRIREPTRAASTFFALLQRDLLEPMLLGAPHPGAGDVHRQAERAASDMLTLISHSAFANDDANTRNAR